MAPVLAAKFVRRPPETVITLFSFNKDRLGSCGVNCGDQGVPLYRLHLNLGQTQALSVNLSIFL